MYGDADLATVGAAIGDRARAQMLAALLGGRALTATELAHSAGVAASTATGHLERLDAAGLIVNERHGRHRYVRLAGPDVAHAIESLAAVAPPQAVRSLRAASATEAERSARSCYDHLAGALGVTITDRLCALDVLDRSDLQLLNGEPLRALGVEVVDLPHGRRPLTRACLDWSERRHHVAGAVGAALLTGMLERKWVTRRQNSRALILTRRGSAGLREVLGLEL